MSFVALGGDAGGRPTFFELVAAEKLMPSLKAAVIYSLSVYAQRQPGLHRVLDRDDELFFLLSVLLDRQALAASGGSFAEGLYGLRRAPVLSSSPGGSRKPLSPSQRHMSLILLTLVPFLRSKLDALYQRLQQQQQQQRQQQQAGSAPRWQQLQARQRGGSGGGGGRAAAWQQLRAALRPALLRAFQLCYPWLAAGHEGARFAYQLLHLLGRTPFFSPELHLLGLEVVRVTGQEAMQQEQGRQQRRAARLSRLAQPQAGPWLWRVLRVGAARAGYLAADHTRSALILAVFGFKLLEWWYGSAEQRLGADKAPPPPPPPALRPVGESAGGVALPDDVALCPLCHRRRTNPTLLATSGYVFCYPCIHREVGLRGRCPVTHAPARIEHVRRLYQGA